MSGTQIIFTATSGGMMAQLLTSGFLDGLDPTIVTADMISTGVVVLTTQQTQSDIPAKNKTSLLSKRERKMHRLEQNKRFQQQKTKFSYK